MADMYHALPDFEGLIKRSAASVVIIQDRGRGLGAGVIWKQAGLVLTNHHVASVERPGVIFSNGREETGRVIARDETLDLALLQVPETSLRPLETLRLEQVRLGQLVIALGHPLGHRNYTTMGIVSAIGRAETRGKGKKSFPVVRTDLVLLPGNSGGPLLDAAGRVIGINTMVVGGDQGYAIPVELAEALHERAGLAKI